MIILAAATALALSAQMLAAAKAEDTTTIIRKDQPEDLTTIVKKRDDINLFPIPHAEEHETIIHKERGNDDED